MATLTPADRKSLPGKDFAGPGRSFPITDLIHAHLALMGATRALNAGHITSAEADAIRARAHAFITKGK